MPEPLYILVKFVLFFIEVLQLAMLLRAIMSWFVEGDGKFTRFLYVLTEPVIIPIRKLFHKMNWFQDSPIDISFTMGLVALMLAEIVVTLMI